MGTATATVANAPGGHLGGDGAAVGQRVDAARTGGVVAGWREQPRARRTRWELPSTAAIVPARRRAGAWLYRVLFQGVAGPIATPKTKGAFLGGLRLLALDGTTTPCDLALWDGRTPGPAGARTMAAYAGAEVTWWPEGLHAARGPARGGADSHPGGPTRRRGSGRCRTRPCSRGIEALNRGPAALPKPRQPPSLGSDGARAQVDRPDLLGLQLTKW